MEQLPFDKRSGKIWFNNELVEWQDTKVHVISHGMHYASLVFEGLRVYNSKIFKLEEHTDRLFKSAKILDMKKDLIFVILFIISVSNTIRLIYFEENYD